MFYNVIPFLLTVLQNVNSGWQSLAPSSAVADYLSHLPASTLPLSLHHFLKYSAESIKKESQNPLSVNFHANGKKFASIEMEYFCYHFVEH